jgi:leucine efflux protein
VPNLSLDTDRSYAAASPRQVSSSFGFMERQVLNIQNYTSFIIAVIVFQIIPGAGTIAILNATGRQGVSSGMKAVFGTLSGDFIYMLAAVLGLAGILSAYPNILAGVQWLGVTYLCWIGLKLLRAPVANETDDMASENGDWKYFRQALAVSLTNPKVIMFFMAFFPLFLGKDSTSITLLVLMGHVTTISFVYQTCLVLVGNSATKRLSRWRPLRSVATRLAGISLIGFGVKLAFNNR